MRKIIERTDRQKETRGENKNAGIDDGRQISKIIFFFFSKILNEITKTRTGRIITIGKSFNRTFVSFIKIFLMNLHLKKKKKNHFANRLSNEKRFLNYCHCGNLTMQIFN